MGTLATVPKELESGLAVLKSEAEAIVVSDQESYMAACTIALAARNYIKDVKSKLDPGINSAKQHLDELRNQRERYILPANTINETVSRKAEAWKAEERRKAAEEERRINEQRRLEAARIAEEERRERERIAEEARKQAQREAEAARRAGEIGKREAERLKREADEAAAREKARAAEEAAINAKMVEEVKVQPSVPKVAGIRARINYRFEVVDATKIPRAFLMPDEKKIGELVRGLKNSQKAMELIPGIRAYEEDAV